MAVMKASLADSGSNDTLAPALATNTLPSQKDKLARQIKEAMDFRQPDYTGLRSLTH